MPLLPTPGYATGNQSICVFVLTDTRNGYSIRLQMEKIIICRVFCSRIVLELLDGLENKSPKQYMDNYYTSPELFLELYKKGLNA